MTRAVPDEASAAQAALLEGARHLGPHFIKAAFVSVISAIGLLVARVLLEDQRSVLGLQVADFEVDLEGLVLPNEGNECFHEF